MRRYGSARSEDKGATPQWTCMAIGIGVLMVLVTTFSISVLVAIGENSPSSPSSSSSSTTPPPQPLHDTHATQPIATAPSNPAAEALCPNIDAMPQYAATHRCGAAYTPAQIVDVDDLSIGAGYGALISMHDLAKAKTAAGEPVNAIILEREGHIGGRYESVDLPTKGPGSNRDLRFGLGAMRTNPSTMPGHRRLLNEMEVPLYCSIFNNEHNMRGRNVRCGLNNECHIFGNFCSSAPQFINDTTPVEGGAAFRGLEPILDNTSDLEGDAYWYLLGYMDFNPATGLDCDNGHADMQRWCPDKAVEHVSEWKEFLRVQLGEEYANLMLLSNVGFIGDGEGGNQAKQYLNWFRREYDTLSINCYPFGGLMTLAETTLARAQAFGVDIRLHEEALCVDRVAADFNTAGEPKYIYEVRTADRLYRVHGLLIHNGGSESLLDDLEGNVVAPLAQRAEVQAPNPAPVFTLMAQWPTKPLPWFWDIVDTLGASYSYRQYGDRRCTARFEVIDTPEGRMTGAIRPVYSDFQCQQMWVELLEKAERENDYSELQDTLMRSIREIFPDKIIPDPIFIKGKFWERAWYFQKASSTVTTDQIASFAENPFVGNTCDQACLVGEAWDLQNAAWTEATINSSQRCLLTQTSGAVHSALAHLYAQRETIVADHYDNDNNFAAYPGETTPGQSFPILSNEHFAPFGCLLKNDGTLNPSFKPGDDCGEPQCVAQGVPVGMASSGIGMASAARHTRARNPRASRAL